MKKRYIFSLIIICIILSLFLIPWKSNSPKIIHKTNSLPTEEKDEPIEEDDDPEDERPAKQVRKKIQQSIRLMFHKNVRIVAIGDSLTQGVGDETDNNGYVGIVEQSIDTTEGDISFSNYGKRGNRTDQLLVRLDEHEIISDIKRADIVLLTIGANDIMEVVKNNFTHLTLEPFIEAQAGYEERLTQILSTITTYNQMADVYLIGFYNPFHQHFDDIEELELIVDDWNEISEQTANHFANVTYIPIKDAFDHTDDNLFSDDHFHPNHAGYERIASEVIHYLTEER
ncbi:MAG TPA: SGNH/GDSL hydrolase family protein [Bacillota bacterium]|nr:SGNH/GDSL hydrolase family protein [Bacillota bacterium]